MDNGALSSCPAGEGHTWGKVSADCVETSSVYVHCDVTAVLPWLVCALLATDHRRPGRSMYGQIDDAVGELDEELRGRRDELLAKLVYRFLSFILNRSP